MNLDAEQALFDACLEADAAGRERLFASCSDAALAARVRRLLQLHEQGPPSLSVGVESLSPLAMPQRIGHYRILERIGEGAMGEVYLAEQQEPVRRRVALKVLKFGLGTREVIARFELERQALAVLAHPNIAGILDAGATGDGRPYFAMEYVGGIAITRYCDERRLPIEGRLALFAQVCAGVQHAHLRGIIHRDLKPSNILVTEIDGAPACRIIDFGIAKATTTAGADTDAHTRIGHILGTPDYMSPEQAQLSPLEIDARTDVYSLGIVLYELLTGARPYSVTRDAIAPETLAREIAESEPLRPSARAAEAGADAVRRAQLRGLTPRSLAQRLRGDLDWIVHRAIEKDRNRRYASAHELADDLERHARNEAVLAGPPSWTYRTGRFVRRHRLAAASAAGLFLSALLFGAGMAWLARETAQERDRANAEAEIAKRVTAFTAGLFGMANPESAGASGITARELLDAGVRRMEAELLRERPEIRAALLEAAGSAYRGIGEHGEASRLIGQAVTLRRERGAAEPLPLARALLAESALRRDQGSFEVAADRAREAVQALGRATGGGRLDGDSELAATLATARLDLAEVLRRSSQLDEASSLAAAVIDGLEQSGAAGTAEYVYALFELGRIRAAQDRFAEAETLLRRAHSMQLATGGGNSERAVETRNGLADVLVLTGRPAEAEQLLRQNLESVRLVYGDRHGQYGIAWNNLANAISDIPEKYGEAEQAYLKALELLSSMYGLAHPEVATTYNNLGALYLKTREWDKAAQAQRRAMELREALLGATHPYTAGSKLGYALALNRLGRASEAEQLLREVQAALTQSLGPEHSRTLNAQYYLGVILKEQGKTAEALPVVRAAREQLARVLGADHPRTQAAQRTLDELEGR
ncbi:MAG TPA: tetratricopeptide repeat protein [Steroidobacteraceae bacterium]|nr:tetratricopeptide repeat protein [Steroidobacteraceae bacterium]